MPPSDLSPVLEDHAVQGEMLRRYKRVLLSASAMALHDCDSIDDANKAIGKWRDGRW